MIYLLSIGPSGWMSMSVLSPRLQIVNGLPDSPKMEAKGALLVRGSLDMLTGLSPSQVCSWAGYGLSACPPMFVVL